MRPFAGGSAVAVLNRMAQAQRGVGREGGVGGGEGGGGEGGWAEDCNGVREMAFFIDVTRYN